MLFVWSKEATEDNLLTMTPMGQIYNPTTQTFLSNEFLIGNVAIDGSDQYDLDNMTVKELAGGNIVVSWVRTSASVDQDTPVFSVLAPDGSVVMPTTEVEASPETQATPWESPAVITALADGRFLAMWVNDGASDNALTMTIEGRIFNANGTPATGDFSIASSAVDGTTFDVSNVTAALLPNGHRAASRSSITSNDTFMVSRVGSNDGNATGVVTAGPITSAGTNLPIVINPIDGTAGADLMSTGYVDAQGDQIDGADGIRDVVLAVAETTRSMAAPERTR